MQLSCHPSTEAPEFFEHMQFHAASTTPHETCMNVLEKAEKHKRLWHLIGGALVSPKDF